jgi:cobalt-zinc-cadmium efflux system outer membrane protein
MSRCRTYSQFTAKSRSRRLPVLLVGLAVAISFGSIGWGQQTNDLPLLECAPALSEPLPGLPPATAADGALTLEQLEQKALASNPSIRRLAALVNAARGNTLQVGLLPNPSVGYEGQQLGSGGLAEQHGVLFSQEIVRGGKLRLNRAVADRERMRLEQELAAQTQRVLTDVRIAFVQVLLAQRQIELTNSLIRIGSEAMQSVEALHKAGDVGKADILQAQIEIENSRIMAENARNRLDAAWRNLAAVTGDPALPPQPLVGDSLGPAKEFEYQEALARLLAASPEISVAAMNVERARLALERARVERVSNVSFQGLFNWQDNGIGGKPDGGVAVTIPVPIFNRNQGGIARADNRLCGKRLQDSKKRVLLRRGFLTGSLPSVVLSSTFAVLGRKSQYMF